METGPQSRGKKAARAQQESHKRATKKPQENCNPQKYPQEKNKHDTVQASARVKPRSLVGSTSQMFSGQARCASKRQLRQPNNRCFMAQIKTKRARFLSTFLAHVRPSRTSLADRSPHPPQYHLPEPVLPTSQQEPSDPRSRNLQPSRSTESTCRLIDLAATKCSSAAKAVPEIIQAVAVASDRKKLPREVDVKLACRRCNPPSKSFSPSTGDTIAPPARIKDTPARETESRNVLKNFCC